MKYIFIYVCENENYCKVGISRNPELRVKSFRDGDFVLFKTYGLDCERLARRVEVLVTVNFQENIVKGNEWYASGSSKLIIEYLDGLSFSEVGVYEAEVLTGRRFSGSLKRHPLVKVTGEMKGEAAVRSLHLGESQTFTFMNGPNTVRVWEEKKPIKMLHATKKMIEIYLDQ